jgi:hypothetical protein
LEEQIIQTKKKEVIRTCFIHPKNMDVKIFLKKEIKGFPQGK